MGGLHWEQAGRVQPAAANVPIRICMGDGKPPMIDDENWRRPA